PARTPAAPGTPDRPPRSAPRPPPAAPARTGRDSAGRGPRRARAAADGSPRGRACGPESGKGAWRNGKRALGRARADAGAGTGGGEGAGSAGGDGRMRGSRPAPDGEELLDPLTSSRRGVVCERWRAGGPLRGRSRGLLPVGRGPRRVPCLGVG